MKWAKIFTIVILAGTAGYLWTELYCKTPEAGRRPGPTPVPPSKTGTLKRTSKAYRGNPDSKILHTKGCRYYDPKKLTAAFSQLEEALDAGYRACRICIEGD